MAAYLNGTFFLFMDDYVFQDQNQNVWASNSSNSEQQFLIYGQIGDVSLVLVINQAKVDGQMQHGPNAMIPMDMF